MSEIAYLFAIGPPSAAAIGIFAATTTDYMIRIGKYREGLSDPQLPFDFAKPEKPRYRDSLRKGLDSFKFKK